MGYLFYFFRFQKGVNHQISSANVFVIMFASLDKCCQTVSSQVFFPFVILLHYLTSSTDNVSLSSSISAYLNHTKINETENEKQ